MATYAPEPALTSDSTYGMVDTAMLQHARQELLVLLATLALGFQSLVRVDIIGHKDGQIFVSYHIRSLPFDITDFTATAVTSSEYYS
jgi:hypothetical protein